MELKKFEHKFNICIVGNEHIGKTSYIKRLIDDTFVCAYKKTSGIETFNITREIQEKNFLFKIWDISGNTKPFNISNDLYRTVDAFIFSFALNDSSSFESVREWIDSCISKKISLENCILLCFKSDLENENKVNLDNVRKVCEDYEIEFFEVSSKNNIKVKESFNLLINRILCRSSVSNISTNRSSTEVNSASGCRIF